MSAGPRTILHVDLDAFFAAVEQRDRPELRGKPVIVGGGGPDQRGVVSAASYEARAFGVHSAMPLRTAGRLCPNGVFLPVDGRKYQRASREVMAILRRFTPLVQPISIDEAFLDVTGSRQLFGDGATIARAIKQAVREEVRLTASVGVATTKLVAKIGSDLRKPDGLVVVSPGEEAAFLAPLPISRLWGVGEKTALALREFGVVTIGDLAALPPDALERRFGKHGRSLVARAHGIDPDPVATGEAAKSIGHEHTFGTDTSEPEKIERTVLGMADGVAWRLRAAGLKAATITLKLRDSSFATITRQTTLDQPADLTEPIYEAAIGLLRKELHGQRIRLVGVTASNFREREQLALFGGPEEPRRHQAAEAMDVIRRKYGEKAVTRGRLVRAGVPSVFERDPNSAVEGRLGVPEEPTGPRRRRSAGEVRPPEPDDGIDPPAPDDP
ncbi:MAG TPA: DNA polymerase IV [Candidatus Limnocylindrales bacterium]|nr:DNA polymerase IV [Candidatus Limnocylindrales bacterium]